MILGLTEVQIAVAVTAALGASFVRGLAGFGMAILLVPVLSLAVPPAEAVVVSNWLGLLIGLVGLKKILGASEKSALVIAALAIVATPLGVWLLSSGLCPPAYRDDRAGGIRSCPPAQETGALCSWHV